MGRSVADACLLLAAQAAMDDCDPLSYPVDARAFAVPEARDLGALRVAYTEDFGICPVDKPIRAVFRDRIKAMRHLFRSCDEVTFDLFGEADRCFDVIRAANYVARYRDAYEKDPGSLGPNVRANYEIGAGMTLADMAWAHVEQTRIFRRFQQTFRDYDLVLAPTTPVSPFPWTQLYLAEMDGKPLRNYYHWLSLTYVITLATNPAIALPCGVDHKGMPFGLQVVGPFRGDRALLGAAHAMEQAFAALPALNGRVPDLAKLGQAGAGAEIDRDASAQGGPPVGGAPALEPPAETPSKKKLKIARGRASSRGITRTSIRLGSSCACAASRRACSADRPLNLFAGRDWKRSARRSHSAATLVEHRLSLRSPLSLLATDLRRSSFAASLFGLIIFPCGWLRD